MFSGPRGISEFMRSLLKSYAIRYNLKYRRSGYLFQNRYKSIGCEEEPYLLELVRYVHLNPLRAGMVGGVEQLEGFSWCGHGVLTGTGFDAQHIKLQNSKPDPKALLRWNEPLLEGNRGRDESSPMQKRERLRRTESCETGRRIA